MQMIIYKISDETTVDVISSSSKAGCMEKFKNTGFYSQWNRFKYYFDTNF